ncbi:MAG: BNR repeat domain protein [uncultured Chloroflexi bacterium]|uniref:BNR repeat domain protein n=1 Tax=uncultured Chloroflexota bacterium TaxID=166587 RepID=A0A6J4JQH6_9CHLR|nr:MAG: BNR repeat domain protein [uncultured Chloroflexota bacterium]
MRGARGAVGVAAGENHTLALMADGSVRAWGHNHFGQVGDGTPDDFNHEYAFEPVPVQGLSGVVAVAAGENHSLAVRSDGSLWAWGSNATCQLGNGTCGGNRRAPAAVPGLAGVRAAAGGWKHTLAVTADGGLWGWGYNDAYQLGSTESVNGSALAPRRLLEGVAAAQGGWLHTVALKADGSVWCTGYGHFGQCAGGTTQPRSGFAQIAGIAGAASIGTGRLHNFAVAR